ncbi:MAG TPA: helix-turn-helix transcriptional regulator [Thermoanaerobaculia bacterium]|jgi:transcriptional regulator with XRE-family HTH domain|nr:helix-turn-helix transcriptional regulator [Thermoanaerobaculia bacterium]
MESQTANLVKILKRAISALGLTQKEVEQRLGLSQGYLSRLFGGQIDLKVDHVAQIARVLQVDPEEIFRLAFPSSRLEPSFQAQYLRQAFGVEEPRPERVGPSQLEREIESIVKRMLDGVQSAKQNSGS